MSEIRTLERKDIYKYPVGFPANIVSRMNTDPDILFFGLEDEGAVIGSAAAQIAGPEAEILYFALLPDFQGRGLGTESFIELLNVLGGFDTVKYVAMELPVGADERLFDMIAGYMPKYFDMEECVYRTDVESFLEFNILSKDSKNCVALSEIDDKALRIFSNGLVQDKNAVVSVPIEKSSYRADASPVFIKEGVAVGAALAEYRDGDIKISFVGDLSTDPSVMPNLLRFIRGMLTGIPEETSVELHILTREVRLIISELLGADADDFCFGQRAVISLSVFDEERAAVPYTKRYLISDIF